MRQSIRAISLIALTLTVAIAVEQLSRRPLTDTRAVDAPARQANEVESVARVPDRAAVVRSTPVGPTTPELDVGSANVTGVVLDVTGGVVAGAVLTARALGSDRVLASETSDAEGRFRLRAPDGAVTLQAEAEAYSRARLEVRAPAEELELWLAPASTIVGRVVTHGAGDPVAAALVTAKSADAFATEEHTARSEDDGSFRIGGLSAGRYEIEAAGPSWRSDRSSVALGVADTSEQLVLVVHPATVLTATVRVAGEPCSTGYLHMIGPRVSSVKAGSDGIVRVEGLPPGRYQVSISCLGRAHQPAIEELAIGAEPVTRAWDLEPAPEEESAAAQACCDPSGTIRALVVSAGGSLGTASSVRLAPSARPGADLGIRGRRSGSSFTFEDVPLGQYDVYLERSPETRQSVVLERDGEVAEVSLEAPPSTEISGHVLDQQGSPIADAWVRAESLASGGGEPETAVLTDAEGAFTIAGILPGRYALRAEHAEGRGQLDAVRGGSQGVVLRVSPHARLAGRVKNRAGEPERFSLLGRRKGDSEIHQTSGFDSWTLSWVPAGTYELVAIAESSFATLEVTLEAGAMPDVLLTLEHEDQALLPEWVRAGTRWGGLARTETSKEKQ